MVGSINEKQVEEGDQAKESTRQSTKYSRANSTSLIFHFHHLSHEYLSLSNRWRNLDPHYSDIRSFFTVILCLKVVFLFS